MATRSAPDSSLPERIAVLETKAVTGKLFYSAFSLLVLVVLAISGFFYGSLIPKEVQFGISSSETLNTRFTEVRSDVKNLEVKLDRLISTIRPLVNPKVLGAALKDATSVGKLDLPAALPGIRDLIVVAKQMRVPLPGKDYKEISKPLFKYYVSSQQPLKQELWLTLSDLASTRTSTDISLHPISDAEIAKAKASQNYFEGEVDLSNRKVWKETIFQNGKIKLTKPDNDLMLTNVRFIDEQFELSAQNATTFNLLQSVIESNGPKVTADVSRFKVLQPEAKIARLKTASSKITLANHKRKSGL